MILDPHFLTLADVIDIHDQEIATAGGSSGIRDVRGLESSVASPKATFEGNYLLTFFEMAATYTHSIASNHPFIDGNKRTALASTLTFLYINGYEVNETYAEELADKVLELVTKRITKDDFTKHLEKNSKEMQ